MPDAPKYDAAEALAMIHEFTEEHDPDTEGRHKAAVQLLDDLAALADKVRLRVTRGEHGHVVLSSPGGRQIALVAVTRDGDVLVGGRWMRGETKEVPLQFNPVSGLLESKQDDKYRTPAPGAPRAKRSALAEVVEVAMEFLRPSQVA